VVWSRPSGAQELAKIRGGWIDALDASAASGLIAFAAGRDLHVRDAADAKFERVFAHERSVAGVAFDAKGRRIAAATYGGAMLWYARIADQKPAALKWAGSHVGAAFSPTVASSSPPCRRTPCTAGGCRTRKTCAWAATRPSRAASPSSARAR
jgi:hypothetical protein